MSLAVPDIKKDDGSPPHLPLRTTAIWYPGIPSEDFHLHEDSFAGRDVPLSDYRPLVQVMFGGINGSYLKHLTRISVTVSNTVIVGIDFDYESEGAPIDRLRACRSTMSADDSVKITFPIDGPGGEILTGMQVKGDYWMSTVDSDARRHGAITSLDVSLFCKAFRSVLFCLRLPFQQNSHV